MMWTVLVAGVAHARLFTAPAWNVASQPALISVNDAASPVMQPQVLVEMPVPQRAESGFSPVSALGVALFAAGVGTVAGRQAMLFYSGKKSDKGVNFNAEKYKGFLGGGQASKSTERFTGLGGGQTDKSLFKANKGNIMTQKNGFGTWQQKFQTASGKSKYGVPIFLPNGAVNPAYLAAERKEQRSQSIKNTKVLEAKRKGLIASNKYRLADYVRKAIGNVGSGKEYYQSGR